MFLEKLVLLMISAKILEHQVLIVKNMKRKYWKDNLKIVLLKGKNALKKKMRKEILLMRNAFLKLLNKKFALNLKLQIQNLCLFLINGDLTKINLFQLQTILIMP